MKGLGTVETWPELVRRLRVHIDEMQNNIDSLKIDLQEAIEQRDLWKERCESVIRDTQASEKMSREEWWQAAWR